MGDYLDCGDNSCLFAERKGGMRTNGRCQCLQDLEYKEAKVLRRQWLRLRAERDRLRDALDQAREALSKIADQGCTTYKHHIWCAACTAYNVLAAIGAALQVKP